MYVNPSNKVTDRAAMLAFMQRYSFATIVTIQEGKPIATHLPFHVAMSGNEMVLTSHFAKANPQWQTLGENTLVIFNEPHAYISPVHYDKNESVPTWNYISVHAYGSARIVNEPAAVLQILEHTILYYEPEYKLQWDGLTDAYKNKMMNGIVAFEMAVTELQGNFKLSQNKTPEEQQRIIQTLNNSGVTTEQDIAAYMLQQDAHT